MSQHRTHASESNNKSDGFTADTEPHGFDQLSNDVEAVTKAARNEAERLASTAKEQVQRFAAGQKRNTAETIEDVARMLRDAGENFADKKNLKGVIDHAANTLEDVSETVKNKTFSDIYDDAETFARRRPVATALGAAALGLLIARVLKSSSTKSRQYASSPDGLHDERYGLYEPSYRSRW